MRKLAIISVYWAHHFNPEDWSTSVADPKICIREGGRVGEGSGSWHSPLPRKLLKFLCQNSAFSCKIFACFKMHPANGGAA